MGLITSSTIEAFSTHTIALYLRVSTQEQKTDGYGLEAQEQHLRTYVSQHFPQGRILVYADTHSGAKMKDRPQLQRLILHIREKKVQSVVVWKIDRLSRSLKHLTAIMEFFCAQNIQFTSVQENMNFSGIMGQFVFNLFGSIAELERGIIKSRTMSGIEASARSGNYTGNWAPYGYRKIKNANGKGSILEINKAQEEWVKQIFRWSAYENMSVRKIVERLNKLQVPYDAESAQQHDRKKNSETYKKRLWTRHIIEHMFCNTIYIGEHVAIKSDEQGRPLPAEQRVVTKTPQIIDPVLWKMAQEKKGDRKKFKGNPLCMLPQKIVDMTTPQQRIFCGVKRTNGGFSYRRKRFEHNNISYAPFELPSNKLDHYVWEQVKAAVIRPHAFVNQYLAHRSENKSLLKQSKAELVAEIHTIENEEIPRIHEGFESRVYDAPTTKKRLEEKQVLLDQKKQNLRMVESDLSIERDLDTATLEAFSHMVKDRIENFTDKEKQTLCGLVVKRVELSRNADHYREKKKISGKLILEFSPLSQQYEITRCRSHKTLKHGSKSEFDHDMELFGGGGDAGMKRGCQFVIDFSL